MRFSWLIVARKQTAFPINNKKKLLIYDSDYKYQWIHIAMTPRGASFMCQFMDKSDRKSLHLVPTKTSPWREWKFFSSLGRFRNVVWWVSKPSNRLIWLQIYFWLLSQLFLNLQKIRVPSLKANFSNNRSLSFILRCMVREDIFAIRKFDSPCREALIDASRNLLAEHHRH